MTAKDMDHVQFLENVAAEDVRHLLMKERTYGGSWKQRGGVGAFMMMARKWDRLEGMVQSFNFKWDVFGLLTEQKGSGEDGMVLAEIRDLRRYLLLVESEMVARGVVGLALPFRDRVRDLFDEPKRLDGEIAPGTPEDGGHHAKFSEEELARDAQSKDK